MVAQDIERMGHRPGEQRGLLELVLQVLERVLYHLLLESASGKSTGIVRVRYD